MQLVYVGDPGRRYPELGLDELVPGAVHELAEDPSDGRWLDPAEETVAARVAIWPTPPVTDAPVEDTPSEATGLPGNPGLDVLKSAAEGAKAENATATTATPAAAQASTPQPTQTTSGRATTGARRGTKES